MKKFLLICIGMIITLAALSQSDTEKQDPAGNRFFVGVSYSFISVELKLSSLSLHSLWYGEDLGTHDLTNAEIDAVNSTIDRNIIINNINVEAGMKFLNNPDSKWYFNGKLFFGIAGLKSETYNNVTDTLEYSFDSEFAKPCSGVGFDVGYRFSSRWGLSLRPYFMGTIGKITTIVDNINNKPENVTEVKQDQSFALYGHLGLMAVFTAGQFTLSVGPGVYWLNSRHKYTIDRVNDLTGDTMCDEITSYAVGKSMIDCSIAVEWQIIEPLTLYINAGIAKDLFINTGIHFNF